MEENECERDLFESNFPLPGTIQLWKQADGEFDKFANWWENYSFTNNNGLYEYSCNTFLSNYLNELQNEVASAVEEMIDLRLEMDREEDPEERNKQVLEKKRLYRVHLEAVLKLIRDMLC